MPRINAVEKLSGRAAIVGVAESDLGLVPGKTALQLIGQATARALNDAGLHKEEIDVRHLSPDRSHPAAPE